MASRGLKARLKFNIPDGSPAGLTLSVPVQFVRVKTDDLYERPQIVQKDNKGLLVKSISVMKDSLMSGKVEQAAGKTTRITVNEKGDRVNDIDVKSYLVTDDGEVEVESLDATIGGGKEVEVVKEVDQERRHDWFVDKVYELVVSEDDNPALYKFAEHLDEEGKMALIDLVERESFEKSVGMVVPVIDKTKGKWTVMVYSTKAKVDPLWKDIPTPGTPITPAGAKKSKKTKEIKVAGASDLFGDDK